jgi:hypothetical protein
MGHGTQIADAMLLTMGVRWNSTLNEQRPSRTRNIAIDHGSSEFSLAYIRYSSEDSLDLNECHLVICDTKRALRSEFAEFY